MGRRDLEGNGAYDDKKEEEEIVLKNREGAKGKGNRERLEGIENGKRGTERKELQVRNREKEKKSEG